MNQIPPFQPPFGTDAFEPYMGEAAVGLHYELTQGYVNRANALISSGDTRSGSLARLRFESSGARLHKLWWENLKPPARRTATSARWRVLEAFGGNAKALKAEFMVGGVSIQGSGWIALVFAKKLGHASVVEIRDHNLDWDRYEPLLLIDVWEHAYLLDYGGGRKAYLEAVWNLVDWNVVAGRLP